MIRKSKIPLNIGIPELRGRLPEIHTIRRDAAKALLTTLQVALGRTDGLGWQNLRKRFRYDTLFPASHGWITLTFA